MVLIVLFFVIGTTSALGRDLKDNGVTRIGTDTANRKNVTGQMRKQENDENRTENLKKRATEEIERRIVSLNKVRERISKIKRLTDARRAELVSSIQVEISNLTALNSKIQSETDIEVLRVDVKSIITSYRIYLLYLPMTRIIVAGDELLNTANKLSDLATKLTRIVEEAKSQGENTASLEALLVDMKAKITNVNLQANNAINLVAPLKPSGYPDNKTTLATARTMLQTAWKDLQDARLDAQKIILASRNLKKGETSVTSQPPVSATETTVTAPIE